MSGTPDKLAAYVGIVPRVNQSNDTDNRGRITKQGNRLIRSTLVQCTLTAIRYSGYLNGFYRRIRERRGSGKAIIATARKLLTIIYNTLKNGWVFEDFPAFKINCPLDKHHRRPMTGNAECSKRRLAGLALAPSWLSACATTGSEPAVVAVCPPVVEYSAEFRARAAGELELLPEGSAIVEMLGDYAVMREQASLCH